MRRFPFQRSRKTVSNSAHPPAAGHRARLPGNPGFALPVRRGDSRYDSVTNATKERLTEFLAGASPAKSEGADCPGHAGDHSTIESAEPYGVQSYMRRFRSK